MMKPIKMQKVRIIGLKSILHDLIKSLHEVGLVEIKVSDYTSLGLEGGRPLEAFNIISEQLVRIRSIKTMLPPLSDVSPENVDVSSLLDGRDNDLIQLESQLTEHMDESARLESDITRLQNESKLADWLNTFDDVDFSRLETNTLSYVVGELPAKKLEDCKKKLDKVSKYYNIRIEPRATQRKAPDKLKCLIIYRKGDFNLADELTEFGFSRVSVTPGITLPAEAKSTILKELEAKKKRLSELKVLVQALSKQHYKKIISYEKALSMESERAEITSRFNFTKDVFVLEGWIRDDCYPKLEKIISQFSPKAVASRIEAGHDEIPPTVLSNPKYAEALEYVTTSFSLPNSLELDPTMAYLITLPLFYGMIVGDVMYGIISFFLARWFIKNFKNEMLVNASRIWLLSAIPSIFFGLVFDEWFGVSHFYWIEVINKWLALVGVAIQYHAPIYHALMSRLEDLTSVMLLTIIIGLIHLAIGFLFGAANEWEHNKKHAIGKLSWIGIEVGGALAIASLFFGSFPQIVGYGGAGFMILSVIVLVLTEGLVGVIEVPGLLGNVLSYTRIALVGVAGVMLAEVINMFFVPLPSQGIFALIAFPLLIIMHSINTLIVMFEALIQGGRLNIVEFRSKFLHGGGRLFEPFSMR